MAGTTSIPHLASIRTSPLRAASFSYLAAPLMVFAIGYTRPLVAIPTVAALAYALYRALTDCPCARSARLRIGVRELALIGAIIVLWTYLGGQGGLWYQSPDWFARNAIYRDLILRPWPVVYPVHGSALCYYIGHWLPPASIAHMLVPVLGVQTALVLGNLLLWAWTWLGVMLVVLNLFDYLHLSTSSQRITVLLIFIFFSGLDIVGALLKGRVPELLAPENLHLEWWSGTQFSSMTTCLFWVFNQTIAAWLATMVFMREKTPAHYVLVAAGCFVCGPFATVGLLVLMIVRFAADMASCIWLKVPGGVRILFQEALSPSNILMMIIALPMLVIYFMGNSALHVEAAQQVPSTAISAKSMIAFTVLEAGVYIALLFGENRRNALLYASALMLFICLFVHVGTGYDFTMRASIPPLFVLMVLCAQMVADISAARRRSPSFAWRRRLLIACLIAGAVTPAVEIYRGFYHVIQQRTPLLSDDSLYSIGEIEREGPNAVSNFECFDYKDDPFFKYIAAD